MDPTKNVYKELTLFSLYGIATAFLNRVLYSSQIPRAKEDTGALKKLRISKILLPKIKIPSVSPSKKFTSIWPLIQSAHPFNFKTLTSNFTGSLSSRIPPSSTIFL